MVGPRLRELLTGAPGAGALTGPDVGRGRGEHPVCGDEVEVDVRLQQQRIVDLRWRVRGCPASFAVAAAAATAVIGGAPAAAPQALRERLRQLGDLAPYERHAEAVFLRALAAACAG